MPRTNALIITGYGTNCHTECAYAATRAGAHSTEVVFFSDLVSAKVRLDRANLLIFPGGFLDGDDLGAAHAAALRWKFTHTQEGIPLLTQLRNFLDAGGLILGICNGFQLLVKLGLLPAANSEYFTQQAALSLNDSARFENRWVHLKVNPHSPCVFTRNLTTLEMPVRHGEGKLVVPDTPTLNRLTNQQLIALQYCDPVSCEPTKHYPYNPNGSPAAIAGLTDPSGRILGLMPHPEAFTHQTNHPAWTRQAYPSVTGFAGRSQEKMPVPGTVLLENAVAFLQ